MDVSKARAEKFFNELSRFFSMLTMVAELFRGLRGLNCTMPTTIGKRFCPLVGRLRRGDAEFIRPMAGQN